MPVLWFEEYYQKESLQFDRWMPILAIFISIKSSMSLCTLLMNQSISFLPKVRDSAHIKQTLLSRGKDLCTCCVENKIDTAEPMVDLLIDLVKDGMTLPDTLLNKVTHLSLLSGPKIYCEACNERLQ